MTNIKLQHLKFSAVAYEKEPVLGAALKVNANLSGVSVQLGDLEEQLGLVLFERLSAGIVFTKAGDSICRHVLKTLHEPGPLREDVTTHSGAPAQLAVPTLASWVNRRRAKIKG